MRTYIFLAASCASVGILITFVVVFVCAHYGIDISKNLWVLTIPVVLSLLLNVGAIELYEKYKKK